MAVIRDLEIVAILGPEDVVANLDLRRAARDGDIVAVRRVECVLENPNVGFPDNRYTGCVSINQVMDDLLSHDSDSLPEWSSLAHAIEMEPWTEELVQVLQKQPMGDWFLTVAAALEYMHSKPEHAHAWQALDGDEEDGENGERDREEDAEEAEARTREEAAADWMVSQGFDRKE